MIKGINHITLAVIDIDRAFTFYKDVLGLTPIVKWDKGAYFMAGDIWFCLNLDENRVSNSCYTHYAFTVTHEDFEKLSKKIVSNAKIFKDNTSPGDSLYFLDPDGHKLEIHVGNLESRIKAKKQNPGNWEKVEWYV